MLEALNLNATFFAMLASFLLLVALLKAVAFNPILKAIDDRRTKIETEIKRAELDLEEAAKLRADYSQEQKKARQEAHELLAAAKKTAEESAHDIVAAAQAEAESMKQKAIAEIEREKQKALEDVRNYAVNLSMLAAEKIIQKNIDAQTQAQLMDEAIREVGNLPC
ncbi:F0F1 ATP synthase subunit B [Heliophilum fasciatum]|uniref:ATP synthase subunit b n=1 Tax=Heliophilum fasciatum TaxID=35700 RepID=A0A4R2RYZ0_9FIRM|nr:F0F1 ATP synthase subunit B [Heliophilum fasciatum]MCW2277478.1 F-type H+-transporting ATPase subunit b [Heliophilum fasciatum]TCP65231.1 ATP synthase F0 subcomplex B subunit [Heliophilum fasciatum]